MGTINFIITANTTEHVFNKSIFKYMYSSYTSGTTGSIFIYFAAEGNIVDPDLITLTVNKHYISTIIRDISEILNKNGLHTIEHSKTSGIYQYVTAMTYTAG